jgi:hypothetical protein
MAGYPTLGPKDQTALLRSILDRIRRAGPQPAVVVFDLDGTLHDNRPRSTVILKELADAWEERFPEAAARARQATPERLEYLLQDTLGALGIHDGDLHQHAVTFWKERFFRDHYLQHDQEVPGAAAFARAAHEAGAILVYLTGRDMPNMSAGSWSSLRTLGFPIGVVGTELVCKPSFDIPDETFKRGVAPTMARLGEVIAAFDNEPANCNLFLRAHPSCTSVLLDTQHVPGAPALEPGVVCLESFLFDADAAP